MMKLKKNSKKKGPESTQVSMVNSRLGSWSEANLIKKKIKK